jgi:hypothetical protein
MQVWEEEVWLIFPDKDGSFLFGVVLCSEGEIEYVRLVRTRFSMMEFVRTASCSKARSPNLEVREPIALEVMESGSKKADMPLRLKERTQQNTKLGIILNLKAVAPVQSRVLNLQYPDPGKEY